MLARTNPYFSWGAAVVHRRVLPLARHSHRSTRDGTWSVANSYKRAQGVSLLSSRTLHVQIPTSSPHQRGTQSGLLPLPQHHAEFRNSGEIGPLVFLCFLLFSLRSPIPVLPTFPRPFRMRRILDITRRTPRGASRLIPKREPSPERSLLKSARLTPRVCDVAYRRTRCATFCVWGPQNH